MTPSSTTPVRPLKVVVAKVGLDGHDRGVKVIARALRDAGMEVVYTGLRRSPDDLANIVLQEDADVLGLSILSGGIVPLTDEVLAALRKRSIDDILVVVGGITSAATVDQLSDIGVAGVFGPGSSMRDIVAFVRDNAPSRT